MYARPSAERGFITLAFDPAYQSESEGEPRGLEDPSHRVEDIKAAVSFLSARDQVALNRVGALGIRASGGYVIPATATDHRIMAVAAVSAVDMGRQFRNGADGHQAPAIIQGMLDAATDDQARAGGQHVFEGWEYYCTAWMTTDAFANAQEPKELCWIKGATHVALYDRDEYVTPAVSKLVEFFRNWLTA